MTKIAIIEDDAAISQMYRMKFETDGFDVRVASNGKLGVELAKSFKPDVILLDIQMPEMNGLEAAKTIRRMERSDARAVPIIAMTADAFRENIGRCLEAGMDAHLAKPVDVQEMGRVLVKFLAKGR